MISFLQTNISTIIVGLIVIAVIVLVIMQMHKDRKAGRSACGCKCAGCPNASLCHPAADTKSE